MPKANPNLSVSENRRQGAGFRVVDRPRDVPNRFRTFEGFERFGPTSVARQFSPRADLTPAQNRVAQAGFDQNLLLEKIRFVNPNASPEVHQELVGLHNQLTELERSGLDRRGIARPLLDRLERTPDFEGNLPRKVNLNDPTQTFGRGGQLSPILPNIGGREGARTGGDIVSGTRLNRAGINAVLDITRRPGSVASRGGATIGEGRR